MAKRNSLRKYAPFISVLIYVVSFGFIIHAQAAPISFSTAGSVTIISPSTTLTIATGSTADTLQVNATSVAITLSSTTSGSFTISSPSYDLSVASSSGGGIATITCNNGIDSIALSQSSGTAMYTVTPNNSSNCANASNNTSGITLESGGSSGGGATSPEYPSVATTTSGIVSTTSTLALEAELSTLEAQFQSLTTQLADKNTVPSPFEFTYNMALGSTKPDVRTLQQFLVKNDDYPKAIISGYYGTLTQMAVRVFQAKNGIIDYGSPLTTGYGSVGPKTRMALNIAD